MLRREECGGVMVKREECGDVMVKGQECGGVMLKGEDVMLVKSDMIICNCNQKLCII